MSTGRVLNFLKVAAITTTSTAATVGTLYAGTKYKILSATQTGVINNVSKAGLVFKTDEMTVLPSQYSNGNTQELMRMSLYGDPDLIKKAQQSCSQGTYVKINYDKFLIANLMKGSSRRQVTDIQPIETQQSKLNNR